MITYFFNTMNHVDRFYMAVKRMPIGKSIACNFHDHDFSEIAVVLSSEKTTHHCEGKSCILRPGDVLLLHPGIIHGFDNTENFSVVNLIYDANMLPLPQLDGGELKYFHAMIDSKFAADNPEKPLLHLDEKSLKVVDENIQLMEQEIMENKPGSRLCLFGLFLSTLVHIARAGGAADQAEKYVSVANALYYLNIHFTENIEVDMLAKLCNMSRSAFFDAFFKYTGDSPIRYQRMKRLELARNLLVSSTKSLSEIAGMCGFYDSNHMNRLFTARYGTSPGKMRKEQLVAK